MAAIQNMPLTAGRYACCWFGETEAGVSEVVTTIASGQDAAQTNVYVNGRTEFRSVWDPNTCLSANYHYDEIVAQTCVGAWWQGWGTS